MKKVYAEYFQKSKVFLYPLLEIKKGVRYVPIETYIAWEGVCELKDEKFICLYSAKKDDAYEKFEQDYLVNHKLFKGYYKIEEDKHLYVYDYSKFKHDLDMFIAGKYSKFTLQTKDKISEFLGDVGTIADYIQSYINPEGFHELYAENLGVSLDTIEQVYELCSKPDINKENLKLKTSEINTVKDNFLTLQSNK